ncbi:MAG: recombination protein NinB [Polaromonas sp.]
MKQLFILAHPVARANALKAVAGAQDGYSVRIAPVTRSLEQNALLHAALTDISQQVEWMGKKFSVEIWKRLCMASWLREKREQPMLIPALDGNGFDIIFERTSKLSTTQCSELVEWCFAFGVEHEVKFRDRGLDDGHR